MADEPVASWDEFAQREANWNGLRSACITFDVDFAPEYMIEHVRRMLERFDARATFFCTHASQLLKSMQDDPRYEIALHPFLSPRSTQGKDLDEVIGKLQAWYPTAAGTRFHILGHSYRDLVALGRMGFEYDISTIRFNAPYLLPAWHRDLNMVLLTYSWEDGVCENAGFPMRLKSIALHSPGMKVLNFHPLNVYINGADSRQRLAFLRENPHLTETPQAVADGYRLRGDGAESVLCALLERLATDNVRFRHVRELAAAYRSVPGVLDSERLVA